MTNTPELDENGNPIPQVGGEVTLSKAEYDKLIERIAELKQATVSTVEELKEIRELNSKLKAQVEGSGERPTTVETDVEAAVQKALAAKEAEQAKSNYEEAVGTFLDQHQEFSKENDTDGSKFAAFQKAVARINLGGLRSVTDFTSALSDAYNLMERRGDTAPANEISSSPRGGGTVPRTMPETNLRPEEDKLVKKYFNGDSEAYLKARAKRPEYYEELLVYVK